MAVDTTYYDTIQVPPTATPLEIRDAYRKLAAKHCSDPDVPDEAAPFTKLQPLVEAHQVLSDRQLRSAYDEHGKRLAKPAELTAQDHTWLFRMTFGEDTFDGWIGDFISIKAACAAHASTPKQTGMRDMQEKSERHHTAPQVGACHQKETEYPDSAAGETSSLLTEDPTTPLLPKRSAHATPALHEKFGCGDATSRDATEVATGKRGSRHRDERTSGPSRAQVKKASERRVHALADRLVDRISLWTETDRGEDATNSFRERMQLEVSDREMVSFGTDILHVIGDVYTYTAECFLRSQAHLGVSNFLPWLRHIGGRLKERWTAAVLLVDLEVETDMMALAEKRGSENWPQEKAEYEKRIFDKGILLAWAACRLDIKPVLGEVCDRVLNDPAVTSEKRLQRAEAIAAIGEICSKAARRAEEEVGFCMFQTLSAKLKFLRQATSGRKEDAETANEEVKTEKVEEKTEKVEEKTEKVEEREKKGDETEQEEAHLARQSEKLAALS